MMSCCASCGVKEGDDDVKLKNCAGCHLVKYCGIKCQKEHRSKHKRACKKRAAELHDEILFRQPESTCLGDCPICFLTIDPNRFAMKTCCCQMICSGCIVANYKRDMLQKIPTKCPFCRASSPESLAVEVKRLKDRADKMKDPVAVRELDKCCYNDGDCHSAFEYWSKAVELGDVLAHYYLGVLYNDGGYVEKDEKKAVYHWEKAAIGGCREARFNLGGIEWMNDRDERAVKHFIIGANHGDDKSLDRLKEAYRLGFFSKDDLTAALRGHQVAVDAMKSPQREEAEPAFKGFKGNVGLRGNI